jgi:alkylation response protein AidB-like acyl-CoA dehydrogenase
MNFTLAADQRELAAAVRDLLEKECAPAVARAGDVGAVWPRLAEMGVLGLTVSEAGGGLGLGSVEMAAVCEEAGRAALPGPLAETFAALAVAGDEWMEPIVSGSSRVSAAAPYAAYAGDAAAVLVGTSLVTDRVGEPVESVDPARPLFRVDGPAVEGPAYDVGALAVAAYLVGAGRAMIDRAVAYALTREQFGRAIGSFQAVKHRLADALVAVEFARPVVYAAALALDDSAPTAARDVSHAKLRATQAAETAAKAALQVHGAIGYTEECDLVIWLRRTWSLASAFGTVSDHRTRIIASLA